MQINTEYISPLCVVEDKSSEHILSSSILVVYFQITVRVVVLADVSEELYKSSL